ncbi:MAG: hypothetical protein NVSMB25_16870 [Thermoleophilaceae bacterium]
MNFELPPVGGLSNAVPVPREPAPAGNAGFSAALGSATKVEAIPATPPPDLLDQLYSAARVAEELRAQSRELHFEPTREGRVIVQVRDLDGNVIRTIPAVHAVEVATGAPLRP